MLGTVLRLCALVLGFVLAAALVYGLVIATFALTMDHFEPGRHAFHMCLLEHRGLFDRFIERACRVGI